jgi:hypothetical protein
MTALMHKDITKCSISFYELSIDYMHQQTNVDHCIKCDDSCRSVKRTKALIRSRCEPGHFTFPSPFRYLLK